MNKRQKEVIHEQLTMEKLVLDELEKEYKAALKDINLKIQMYQAMPETQSRIYHKQYQETLKKQIEAALEKLHSDEYATINEYLHDSYTDAFVGTMYDLHGQGVPVITPIDLNAVIKAVMKDTKLNKPLYTKLGVDVNKLKRTVSSEISRGLASGLTYDSIARNIEFHSKAPLSRAKTIVRTEGHRIQQASSEDARQEAKAKGADLVKQWDSTLDGDTRPTHRRLDGQIRETDELFEMDGKKAKHPGGFGDPAEDCNCRCVALTRPRSALDEDELKTMQERAKFFELDKSDRFEDFKKKYLKAAEEETKYSALSFMEKKKLIHDNEQQVQNLIAKKKQEEFKVIMSMNAEEMQSAQQNAISIQKQIDELKKANQDIQKELGLPANAKERFFDQKVDVSKLPQDILESELGAISSWTRSGYTTINAYKRTSIKTGYPGFVKDCETLEKLIDRNVVKEQFTVRRGTDGNALNKLFGNDNWKKEGFNANGRIIQDLGFMATSPISGGGFGSNIQMYIDVPAGAKGVYIGDKSAAPNEKEFLLQSGTCFAVERIEESKDKWGESRYDIYLRVIVDEE